MGKRGGGMALWMGDFLGLEVGWFVMVGMGDGEEVVCMYVCV